MITKLPSDNAVCDARDYVSFDMPFRKTDELHPLV